MKVSIVIPALNESQTIAATLAALQPLRGNEMEIIVVDGGSVDATIALATPLADRLLVAARGRAVQMNAGAAQARGDVLVFLHADSLLPPAAVETMLAELAATRRRWGRFDVTIAGATMLAKLATTCRRWGRFDVTIVGRLRLLKLIAALMNWRSRITGIATGDQAIFVDRALFEAVGGFAPLPLMEDIALSKMLKRVAGAPLCLSTRIVTSGRRWEARGLWRTIVCMWRLRLWFLLGVDPARLARSYERP